MYWQTRKIILSALLVIVVGGALLYFYPEDASQEPIVGPRTAVAEADSLVARAWIESNRIYPGQKIRLRLTFDNRADIPASIALSDIQAPGFDLEAAAFHDVATGLPGQFPIALRAGASVTLESKLEPTSTSYGRFSIGASYAWTRRGNVRNGVVLLDPVEITSWYRERTSLMANRVYSAVKDLTLPLILALLAYVLQRTQKDREMSQTIWTSQLPRMHEYAEKYYLPIVRSLRSVISAHGKLKPTPATVLTAGDSTKRYSYELLMFLRRMRALREDKGGVFFKNRGGEHVAQAVWYVFYENVSSSIGEDTYESALKALQLTTTYEDFSTSSSAVLTTVHAKLVDWMNGIGSPKNPYERCLELLRVLQQVLSFEANRPFDAYWYETPDTFDLKQSAKYNFPLNSATSMTELKKKLDAYYEEVQAYLKKQNWDR